MTIFYRSSNKLYAQAVQGKNGNVAPLEGDGRLSSPFKIPSAGERARKNTDYISLILRSEVPFCPSEGLF